MSSNSDQPLLATGDFWAALGLLTRLPIHVNIDLAQKRGASAAWAYPLVGVFVGLALALVAQISMSLGLSSSLSACIVLFSGVMLTGALHEDGLADSADGLWGGYTPERRLEIMKDSAIGTYGVLALILSLLIRWAALEMILSGGFWLVLVAVGTISRTPMVLAMAMIPNARKQGLSHSVGRPSKTTALVAALSAGFIVLLCLGVASFILVTAVVAVLTFTVSRIGIAKIGGQTGDILGAMQQIGEIGAMLAIVAMI